MDSDRVPSLSKLALTLDVQGRLALALEVVRQPVSRAGPFAAQFWTTLSTLVAKDRDADDRNR